MDLSSYGGLISAVPEMMAREGDAALVSFMPAAVQLAEAKFNRLLRVAAMEAFAEAEEDDDTYAGDYELPGDFLEMRRVQAPPYGELKFVTPGFADDMGWSGVSGVPVAYTIRGSTLTVFPTYGLDLEMDYYAKIPALGNDNASNWLLASHPDLYLFQALAEAYLFGGAPEKANIWGTRAVATIQEMNSADMRQRYARVGTRVRGATP